MNGTERSSEAMDGTTVMCGIQGFQGSRILIPSSRDLKPDRDFLAERYAVFKKAV